MGCTTSKLDNEDTVRRCKDRRRLIKEAVFARHHLAAAHADYCRSLRLTGSALSSFAAGEPLSVSEQTPAVFLHPPAPPSSANSVPPPLPPSPSPSIASSKLPHILSASSNRLRRKQQQPPPAATKLPHILSQSSLSSSPARSEMSNFTANYAYPTAYQADSTYSATPSQASSVWNWENFRPPSPPDSEFFNHNPTPPLPPQKLKDLEEADDERTETGTEPSDYDFFHKKQGYAQPMENPTVGGRKYSIDEDEAEQEEVHCSEWGDDHDRYSTTSSSDEGGEDKAARSEIGTRSNFGGSMRGEEEEVSDKYRSQKQQTPSPPPSSRSYRKASESDMRMVVRHKDLKEIVESINENFERAAAAGDQVSELLEMGRAQLDRSFRQLKKTVYHSSSVLSNLSSSWTSKPPLAVKYRLDTAALSEPGGTRSLCSTLERLLAWEKKLYDEVKARESVKIEHEKKLSTLQSQEYKGGDRAKLDKTKTSINRLQSLIIVTSQAVSTTSTAIVGLRDADLVPQLVDLCHGFMYMWRSMHQYHEVQNNIVQQVSGLVNRSMNGHSTSELHRQATRDLESAVSAWHSSFNRLMKYQRDFIRSIQTWFKLTLLPVTNHSTNTTNNLSTIEHSDVVYTFCDEWKLALDRVPDTVASEAIKSFINVVHVISAKQTEELKMKKRTETASKELEKKASSLRNIERKFYQSYSMVGVGMPDEGGGHGLDARDPLSEKKSELATCQRRVEDEMVKHGKAVEVTRAMTLNNLQTGLPGVFQALTSFSALFTEALDTVCTHSYGIK